MRRKSLRTLAAAVLGGVTLFTVPGTVEATVPGTVEVAAASDLRFALGEIVPRFERLQGVRVRAILGSSGQLAAQIAQGAPFDVFFSADESFVRTLAAKGAIRGDSIRLYAIGRIVTWVRADSRIDVGRGLAALMDNRVRYIAIANPAHAPYGLAAEQALRSANVYERVRAKLVLGENVSQALQFAQTGNADVGIIALSLAVAPPVKPVGRYWIIPSALHRPIRQAVGVTARSHQPALADTFIAFVNSLPGREIMRRYGFALPDDQP